MVNFKDKSWILKNDWHNDINLTVLYVHNAVIPHDAQKHN